ncbi:MAG TPA: DUF2252 domain-containing protein, partial [Chloroflexota bacterium]
TLPGPWEWDIKRLAASVIVAGRASRLRPADCSAASAAAARSYRERMAQYAQMGYVALYYAQIDGGTIQATLSSSNQRKILRKDVARARSRDNLQALDKLTAIVNGQVRIKDDPPLVTHVSDPQLGDRARQVSQHYMETLQTDRYALLRRYSFVDAALKVVGVGSVGTRCFIALFSGASHADPLFLQIKEAHASVLEPYLGESTARTHGERVVAGQRIIQAASDIFLGWGTVSSADYYIRQLRDMKGVGNITEMTASDLLTYAGLCGWALALAHARSGDAAQIRGYLGTSDTFDLALTAFANAYADQTERDHAALVAAVNSGRIAAQTGV